MGAVAAGSPPPRLCHLQKGRGIFKRAEVLARQVSYLEFGTTLHSEPEVDEYQANIQCWRRGGWGGGVGTCGWFLHRQQRPPVACQKGEEG